MIKPIGTSAAYAAYLAQKRANSIPSEAMTDSSNAETPAAVVEISDEAREALAEAMAQIEDELKD